MKLAALFFAIALPAFAETPSTETPATQADVCEGMGDLAATLMRNRQDGIAMSVQMTLLENTDPSIKEMLRLMIIEAYDRARFSTEEYKQRSIDDFRTVFEAACYSNG